ncbi:uncharacterized protein PITG_04456 [Phytophthora infestans T30-4]|uniref:Uncharacterized protein n=1 Tax=Phytophthora infestans (strain T30-4) TaxID=403677 RepID=D0N1B0_PHYIT|nr:uncharacterized protein PITG_04456 [Phytophthora infestans T30-4]EEY67423.1 hypothetical protein PITG_04456 [Phytophthora infestans T30-4]|eukprot:XP_002906071.1 hypothetical protein PITG_04456 [Phytophthora infestans T30-4]
MIRDDDDPPIQTAVCAVSKQTDQDGYSTRDIYDVGNIGDKTTNTSMSDDTITIANCGEAAKNAKIREELINDTKVASDKIAISILSKYDPFHRESFLDELESIITQVYMKMMNPELKMETTTFYGWRQTREVQLRRRALVRAVLISRAYDAP